MGGGGGGGGGRGKRRDICIYIHVIIYICMYVCIYINSMCPFGKNSRHIYDNTQYLMKILTFMHSIRNNFVQWSSNFCTKIVTQIVYWVAICSN